MSYRRLYAIFPLLATVLVTAGVTSCASSKPGSDSAVAAATDISAEAVGPPNDLGTPVEASQLKTENYEQGVEAAFPRYADQQLMQRLEAIVKKYPQGFDPIKIRDLRAVAQFFGAPAPTLSPNQLSYESEQLMYEVEPQMGKVYFYRNLEAAQPMPLREAEKLKARVALEHEEILTKIGVDRTQILFKQTSFILHEGSTNPVLGSLKQSEPVVDSTFTYALRSLNGIMVEGSSVKIASKGLGKIETVNLAWPRFQFHSDLKRMVIKDKNLLKREVLAKVKESASGKVNIKMAVVLRPVFLGQQQVFVPALRVGVMPTTGEAGDLFYVDLPRQQLSYREGELSDEVEAPRSID